MFPIDTKKIALIDRLRMLVAFYKVVKDVNATDDVFVVAEKIPDDVFDPAIEFLKDGPWTKATLERRTSIEFRIQDWLKLPNGTLGREYAEFMVKRGLSPDFHPAVQAETAGQYTKLHFYQTHDLWHVVTGYRANPAGEIALLAFYYAQTKLPLPVLLIIAGLLNAAFFAPSEVTARIEALAEGYQKGKAAHKIFGYPWHNSWEKPLAQVRAEMGIQTEQSAIPLQHEIVVNGYIRTTSDTSSAHA